MSGRDNSHPKEDLRMLTKEELDTKLEQLGLRKENFDEMSRWEKVNKIRELTHQPNQ